MGLKAAIQALKKAEKLKEKVQNSKDLLNDNEAWVCQQQLQRIYQQVLILDLEYALDRKVEQELWNHGFKNYIGTLQNLAKDKKNPKRPESQAMLSWCLEAASGFYLTLLQEICTAFDLDLPFRRKGSVYGNGKLWRAVEHLSQPHKSSCYYICQHCLVHLGDIARYRNQSRQAEAFYRHAVQLAPHSGQPYNQLALLEASRGDRLSTVFHYVRSVAVRHPFPAAATNLVRTITKCVEEQLNVEGRNKLSTSEYVSVFLKLHGLLHTGTQLAQAERYVKILTTTLTAHVATESLTSWKLVQMLAINLFALHHSGGLDTDKSALLLVDEQLTEEEQQARHLILDLMAGSLSAFLLPVYTLKEGEALLEYFALPAIKLTLDWIRLEPQVLSDVAFTSRLQIWPSLCKLLNGLQPSLTDFTADKYSYMPLPEDQDLQGFRPLEKSLNNLRFSNQDWKMEPTVINKLRASRLLDFGTWLACQENYRLITRRVTECAVVFEATGGQQVPSSDLIRELEELSLTKLPSPAPSEASSWGSSVTGTSTPDHVLAASALLSSPQSPPPPLLQNDALFERRAGILKPQGSLEKAREKESTDTVWNGGPHTVMKRGRQNVAMQAIMRKSVNTGEQQDMSRAVEAKQVTFKTPSPSESPAVEEVPIPKPAKLSAWQQPQQKQQPVLSQQQQQPQQQQPPQQPFSYQPTPQHNGTAAPQHRPGSFSNHSPLTGAFNGFGTQPSPQVFHSPAHGGGFSAQQQQQQQQPFGMKVRQPPYAPWREEGPPLPPSSWWGGDRSSSAEQNRSQQVGSLSYFNNLIQRNTDLVSGDLFTTGSAWGSQHLNLNLHHQLVGQRPAHYSGMYQAPQHLRQDTNHLSVFTANGNQDADVNALTTPDTNSKADLAPGSNMENSTIFSSNAGRSSFSPLAGLGTGNTYSLFSTPNWSGASPSCSLEADGSNARNGLGGVVGMAGSNSLTMGQQSLWSGPGPSPLERLLEQQKQLREGPAPKGGT
ncbi:nonsense-mediated mRNA decay factor SMG7 [Anabrus simplex]|uniref:nonsense-mediated mRNA decay factor SMG7 n=1 Tax=Anabrus simplex TaxID=316456 RepID=UPI0034DCCF35